MRTNRSWLLLIALAALPLMTLRAQDEETPPDSTKTEKKKDKKAGLPLEPGRTLELETNEGSWLSLDVSPDGQTIVFDLLGDIYALPIAGGKAKRITKGLSYDTHPKYSPDGKFIAYTSDLVVLMENPLEDIRNTNTIEMVMKNGRLYDGNTLDELYPTPRKAPDLEWKGAAPVGVPGMQK